MIEKDGDVFMEQEEYEEYVANLKAKVQEALHMEVNEEGQPHISLYEMNQQIIGQQRTLSRKEYPVKQIKKWIRRRLGTRYFMLLCNEVSYYTLFRVSDPSNVDIGHFCNEFCDLIEELGEVKLIEEDTNGALAVWAKTAFDGVEGIHCFYLFPYDAGVIDI